MSVRVVARDGVLVPLHPMQLKDGEVFDANPVEKEDPIERLRKRADRHGATLPDDWVFDRGELYP